MRLGQAGTVRGVLGDNSGLGWRLGWAGAGVWAGLSSVVILIHRSSFQINPIEAGCAAGGLACAETGLELATDWWGGHASPSQAYIPYNAARAPVLIDLKP